MLGPKPWSHCQVSPAPHVSKFAAHPARWPAPTRTPARRTQDFRYCRTIRSLSNGFRSRALPGSVPFPRKDDALSGPAGSSGVVIDGQRVAPGGEVRLAAGPHRVEAAPGHRLHLVPDDVDALPLDARFARADRLFVDVYTY